MLTPHMSQVLSHRICLTMMRLFWSLVLVAGASETGLSPLAKDILMSLSSSGNPAVRGSELERCQIKEAADISAFSAPIEVMRRDVSGERHSVPRREGKHVASSKTPERRVVLDGHDVMSCCEIRGSTGRASRQKKETRVPRLHAGGAASESPWLMHRA